MVDVGGYAIALGYIGCRGIRGSLSNTVARRKAGNGNGSAVGLAVVRPFAARYAYRNLILGFGNGELAELFLGNGVVALLCGARPVLSVSVATLANRGLGSRGGEVDRLTVYQTIYGNALSGKGRAIIHLVSVCRFNGKRCRKNLVRAGNGTRVVALAGYRYGYRASVGDIVAEGQVVILALLQNGVAVLDLGLLRLLKAVISYILQLPNRHVRRSNRLRRNVQRAFANRGNGVVRFASGAPLNARIGVARSTHFGLRAGSLYGSSFAVDQAIDVFSSACLGLKSSTVIHLTCGRRGYRQRSGRDLVGFRGCTSVVANARDGCLNVTRYVGEIALVVGNRVVGTLFQGVAVSVLHHGSPLVLLAVVHRIGGIIDSDALVGIGMVRIGNDGLAGDGKGAFGLYDVVVLGNELAGGVVGNGVRYLTLRNRGYATRCTNVGYLVGEEEVCANRYLGLRKRSAIVHLGGGLRRYRNGAGNDAQLSFARYHIGEVGAGNAHRNLLAIAHVYRRDGGRILRPVLAVYAVFNYQRAVVVSLRVGSGKRMGGAIVYVAQTCRVKRYHMGNARTRRDAQLALVLGNGVVAIAEAFGRSVFDGVVHFAFGNVGYRTGGLDLRDFTRHKACIARLLPAGNVRTRKSCAVIGLAVGCGRKRNNALIDGDGLFARHIALVIRAGNTNLNLSVLALLAVPGIVNVLCGDFGRVGGPIIAISAVFDSELAAVLVLCLCGARSMRLAIVRCFNVRGCKRYVVGNVLARDNAKNAFGLFDFVVRILVVVTMRPSDGVGLLVANVPHRAGCLDIRGFPLNKARTANGHLRQREGFTRVLPGVALGHQRYPALRNRKRTIFDAERHLSEVLADAAKVLSLEAHAISASIGLRD